MTGLKPKRQAETKVLAQTETEIMKKKEVIFVIHFGEIVIPV